MSRLLHRFKLRCRDAARLLLARENRPLGPLERLSLRAHLLICTACTNFDGQVRFMRAAMGTWKRYRDDE